MRKKKLKLAVLISGSGSNLQAIIDRIEQGDLIARIVLVLSNDKNAYGLERARKHGLECAVVEHGEYADRAAFEQELIRRIQASGAELVALAGFMRILSPVFIAAFPGKIVNIHPALLPAFPGLHAQRQQADYGVRLGGCSVHFVDEKMDHGPIILQAAVPVYPDDDEQSLGARILEMEHRIYPQALQWLAEGRLELTDRQVTLRGRKGLSESGDFFVWPPLEHPF